MLTVIDIVKERLYKDNYDGLFNEDGECACLRDDLAPCGQIYENCMAGHKAPCPGETCEFGTGGCGFHIIAGKSGDKI